MQTIGHLIVNGKKVLVLCRSTSTYRTFKVRYSGKDGVFFEDESIYLEKFAPEKFKELLAGKVISL